MSLTPGFELLETMRCEGGKVVRLARHLERLERSARSLGYRYDEPVVIDAIHRLATDSATHDGCILRLTLSRNGDLGIVRREIVDWATDPVVVSFVGLSADSPILPYKTTYRKIYDAARRAARARGAEEAILVNPRGFVTEGTITNVFVELGGELLTPPLEDGLVPGILRAELLDGGEVREAPITIEMLVRSELIYVGNTVRGLRLAKLTGSIDRPATAESV